MVSLVDEEKPPGKPGIATYLSTKTTKKDTYGPKSLELAKTPIGLKRLEGSPKSYWLDWLAIGNWIHQKHHTNRLAGKHRFSECPTCKPHGQQKLTEKGLKQLQLLIKIPGKPVREYSDSICSVFSCCQGSTDTNPNPNRAAQSTRRIALVGTRQRGTAKLSDNIHISIVHISGQQRVWLKLLKWKVDEDT